MRAGRSLQHAACPKPCAPASPWGAFESNLAAALATFDKEFLVLVVKGCNIYIQLNAQAGGFRCETVSNEFLPEGEQLDAARIAALREMSWRPPSASARARWRPGSTTSPNFHRDFDAPARTAEVARFVVRTFAEVHRVAGPGKLTYESFDGQGHRVVLPSLGIARRAPAEPLDP